MDHVELFCGILAAECENSKLTTWMLAKEFGNIKNLA